MFSHLSFLAKSSLAQHVQGCWRHRGLVHNLVAKEIELRYGGTSRGTWLGLLLVVLQPLVVVCVYMLGLSSFSGISFPNYPLYLGLGVLHWHLLTAVTGRACRSISAQSNLVGWARFPLVLLPLADLITELILFAWTALLFALLIPVLGGSFWIGQLLYLPAILLFCVLMFGLALALSALEVFFRDVHDLWGMALRLGFWFSPVIFRFNHLNPTLQQALYYLNPMAPFLTIVQNLFYDGHLPSSVHWWCLTGWSALFLLLGSLIFWRTSGYFADEL